MGSTRERWPVSLNINIGFQLWNENQEYIGVLEVEVQYKESLSFHDLLQRLPGRHCGLCNGWPHSKLHRKFNTAQTPRRELQSLVIRIVAIRINGGIILSQWFAMLHSTIVLPLSQVVAQLILGPAAIHNLSKNDHLPPFGKWNNLYSSEIPWGQPLAQGRGPSWIPLNSWQHYSTSTWSL
jgi:hypothetical protein